jgi:hypothetical protein
MHFQVHIDPRVKFQTNSLNILGLADDEVGTPAADLLVFQYKTIFSRKRYVTIYVGIFRSRAIFGFSFALNIAWYPTMSLNGEQLKAWFLEIVWALEDAGLHVLATICDGHGTNRNLQNMLIGQTQTDGVRK